MRRLRRDRGRGAARSTSAACWGCTSHIEGVHRRAGGHRRAVRGGPGPARTLSREGPTRCARLPPTTTWPAAKPRGHVSPGRRKDGTMSGDRHQTPEQIRAKLNHPVIDGDGHWVEWDPVFAERMRKVGGDMAADGFLAALKVTQDSLAMSVDERRRRRIAQPAFWSRQASNTLDRATCMMPRLLYERLPEIGTDFAIIYPTAGLRMPRIGDDATRRAVARSYNIVAADYFAKLGDRMTPAAIIPMHTPVEAIGELEYATRELGMKVGMFGSGMSRRLPAAAEITDPDVA